MSCFLFSLFWSAELIQASGRAIFRIMRQFPSVFQWSASVNLEVRKKSKYIIRLASVILTAQE